MTQSHEAIIGASGAYTSTGKQVLRDGKHYADAASNEAAQDIVDMMNLPAWLDERAERFSKARSTARFMRALASDLRAGVHGWVRL